jgi:hypothetical protein
MNKYFDQVGLARARDAVRVFPELDDALEWVEDRLIAYAKSVAHFPTALKEFEVSHSTCRGREGGSLHMPSHVLLAFCH